MDKVVNYFEHEEVMIRMERGNKRLWVLCIILIIALFVTNGWWIYRESQFKDVVTTVTQELDSRNGNAIINDGVHINGESKTDGDN